MPYAMEVTFFTYHAKFRIYRNSQGFGQCHSILVCVLAAGFFRCAYSVLTVYVAGALQLTSRRMVIPQTLGTVKQEVMSLDKSFPESHLRLEQENDIPSIRNRTNK
eukprot:3225866-Amphidinium_carterae.1